jgi:polar amino acid transport system substrate-binding protein
VAQGRADAFAGTSITVRNVIDQTKNSKVESSKPFQPTLKGKPAYGAGAFAFRLQETALRNAFNAELHKMKESGELLRVVAPFGFTKTEMTDLTAKELCKG